MTGLQSLRGRRHVRSGDRPGGEPAISAVTKARSEPPARPRLRDIAAEHNAPSVIFSAHDPQENAAAAHRESPGPPVLQSRFVTYRVGGRGCPQRRLDGA